MPLEVLQVEIVPVQRPAGEVRYLVLDVRPVGFGSGRPESCHCYGLRCKMEVGLRMKVRFRLVIVIVTSTVENDVIMSIIIVPLAVTIFE